jgi:hypothetical protein
LAAGVFSEVEVTPNLEAIEANDNDCNERFMVVGDQIATDGSVKYFQLPLSAFGTPGAFASKKAGDEVVLGNIKLIICGVFLVNEEKKA